MCRRPPPPDIIPHEEERHPTTEVELLRYHYDFGHLPFTKLQQMAKDGILPKRLAKCHIPVCSACQYDKATNKGMANKIVKRMDEQRTTKQARNGSIDRPIGVPNTRIGSPNDGLHNETTIQIRNGLRRPSNVAGLCVPTKDLNRRRNATREASLRTIRHQQRSDYACLPCQ